MIVREQEIKELFARLCAFCLLGSRVSHSVGIVSATGSTSREAVSCGGIVSAGRVVDRRVSAVGAGAKASVGGGDERIQHLLGYLVGIQLL